jgi:hypothetical protein
MYIIENCLHRSLISLDVEERRQNNELEEESFSNAFCVNHALDVIKNFQPLRFAWLKGADGLRNVSKS